MGFMILRYVKLLFYVVQVLYRNFLQQYDSREEPDCRGRLHSAKDGSYSFRGVVWADFLFFAFEPQRISWITSPVSYPVPFDGTVGKMLEKLGRHTMRPAHLHIRINVYYNSFFFSPFPMLIINLISWQAPGYEELVTALYFKGDPYLTSDAVFGVKSSLIVVSFLVVAFVLTIDLWI